MLSPSVLSHSSRHLRLFLSKVASMARNWPACKVSATAAAAGKACSTTASMRTTLRQTAASTAQTALAALAKGYFHSPDAAYRAYKDRAVEQTCDAMAELQRSATAQQRKNMVKALQGYSRDVHALMAQTP